MNEFLINYGDSRTKKIIRIIIGIYLTAFTFYFFITELLAKQYGMLFVFALIGVVLGIIVILVNTVGGNKPLIKIDNLSILSNIGSQSVEIVWTNVSEMNVGVSYLLFIENGRKQQQLDLSDLKYKDMKDVKSKVIEICEFKNIPYKND